MPNSGDNDGSDPLGPVGGGPTSVESPEAGAATEAADGVVQARAPSSSAPTLAIDPTVLATITAAIGNGEMDPQTARQRLIDAAVTARIPAGLSEAGIAAFRAKVEAALADTPLLDQLLRP